MRVSTSRYIENPKGVKFNLFCGHGCGFLLRKSCRIRRYATEVPVKRGLSDLYRYALNFTSVGAGWYRSNNILGIKNGSARDKKAPEHDLSWEMIEENIPSRRKYRVSRLNKDGVPGPHITNM